MFQILRVRKKCSVEQILTINPNSLGQFYLTGLDSFRQFPLSKIFDMDNLVINA
jgi:hypothetical protein